MKSPRPWVALAACAVIVACQFIPPTAVKAGNSNIHPYVLFYGVNTDSTEQASPWIPIKGATKVVVRTYSTHVAFTATNTDKAFSDSIATWKTLFSDSVSFIARDSLGTIVTARSTMSSVQAFPMCADSVSLTGWGVDSTKNVAVVRVAVNKALRAPANGSGVMTVILPMAAATVPGVTLNGDPQGVFATQYMRVRITPLRRMTGDTSEDTNPVRVNGLKGLHMFAYVYFDNK